MPSLTLLASTVFVVFALFAGYLYLFGLSPEAKRKLENKALETMGENKASYLTKSTVSKIPDSDQQNVQDLKKSLGNAAGGALQNPLGKTVGEVGDEGTRDLTGR